jgi:hypothetical protein
MRSAVRLARYRRMSAAEKCRELAVLEAAARLVWRAMPAPERARRRLRLRRERLAGHARLLRRLATAAACPASV